MAIVSESNFDTAFPKSERDEYWRRVKFALRHLFQADEALADRFRHAVEDAPVGEQLLSYHETPLARAGHLAADIDGIGRHSDAYYDHFPDELSGASVP